MKLPKINISPVKETNISTFKVDEMHGKKDYEIKINWGETIHFDNTFFFVGKMENGKLVLIER